jgi:hypothetical protein
MQPEDHVQEGCIPINDIADIKDNPSVNGIIHANDSTHDSAQIEDNTDSSPNAEIEATTTDKAPPELLPQLHTQDRGIDSEPDFSDTSLEVTVTIDGVPWDNIGPMDHQEKDLRSILREDKKVHWSQTRKLILGTLAQFVIARGMEDRLVTITRLAPAATTIPPKKDSIGDISKRVLALQNEVLAGKSGEEQEKKLTQLIASAIFSRKKDGDTKSVIKSQQAAFVAAYTAGPPSASQNSKELAKNLEERATVAAELWMSLRIQEGLQVLSDIKSGKGMDWISKLQILDYKG